METRDPYHHGLQCGLNHVADKLQHQNLLQQQTVHAVELEVQNLGLKITNLKDNQNELAANITDLSKLVKVEIDYKNQLITQLRKQLNDCVLHENKNNPQTKLEQYDDVPILGKPAEKKFKPKDEGRALWSDIQHSQRLRTNSDLGESRNESNSSNKYSLFDNYKRELERRRIKKLQWSKTSTDNSTSSKYDEQKSKRATAIKKTHTEVIKKTPKENQSVEVSSTKNTPNNLSNVGHCNDKVTAEKGNELMENLRLNQEENKLSKGEEAVCDRAGDNDTKPIDKKVNGSLGNIINVDHCNAESTAGEEDKLTEKLGHMQEDNKSCNKVNKNKELKCDFADRDDTKAMCKLMEELAKLQENKMAEKEHLCLTKVDDNLINNKKNKVSKSSTSDLVDKNDSKAPVKVMGEVAELQGKRTKTILQKSALSLDDDLSKHDSKISTFTKNKSNRPLITLDEIATNDYVIKKDLDFNLNQQTSCKVDNVPLTDTVNFKRCVDVMEIARTPETINIINRLVAQEMRNIDMNINEFKTSRRMGGQEKAAKKGKSEKNAVKNENKSKRAEKTLIKNTIDKIKTKEASTRILRSTVKGCNNVRRNILKKIDDTIKDVKATDPQIENADDEVQKDLDSSTNSSDCSPNLKVPVAHIPETENYVANTGTNISKNSNETDTKLECSTTTVMLDKNCEDSEVNIELLEEDLNISSLEESDLQLSANEVSSADCILNPRDNLEKQSVHNTVAGGRKRRKVVITMVD